MAVIRVGTGLMVLHLQALGGRAAFLVVGVPGDNPTSCDNRVYGRYARGSGARNGSDRRRRPAQKKISHEIGQDLSLLSVKELDERMDLLRGEIARLEVDRKGKQASRQTADQFFKK